jgi:small-conductance mechanosensitive channel
MRRFFTNRTVRGLGIVALIAFAVVVFSLESTVATVGGLLRIAFFLAVAFFIFLMWRDRRDEIASWSTREMVVFYGSALLIVAALGLYFWRGWAGYEELGFIGVIACSGFAMWRVWRDRHHYGV